MRVVLVSLILLAAAMSGCAGDKGNDDGDGDASGTSTKTGTGTKSGTKSGSGTGSTTATGTGSPVPHNATLVADVVNGTAPLSVNFTMNATPGATSWRLAFGDGSFTNGTGQPATANHTYAVGGNFSANLTVVYAQGANATAGVDITVAVPAGGAAPDVTHFEFGESSGCMGDAHAINPTVPLNCASFQAGPDASGIDGHWLALDERYWGMTITTTMDDPTTQNQDSDCYFYKADAKTETGTASNGGGLCLGVVPAGTYWLFLYPWALPALGMTADFSTA
jgi:PKD repeat protein